MSASWNRGVPVAITSIGTLPHLLSEKYAAYRKNEIARWSPMVKTAGIKIV